MKNWCRNCSPKFIAAIVTLLLVLRAYNWFSEIVLVAKKWVSRQNLDVAACDAKFGLVVPEKVIKAREEGRNKGKNGDQFFPETDTARRKLLGRRKVTSGTTAKVSKSSFLEISLLVFFCRSMRCKNLYFLYLILDNFVLSFTLKSFYLSRYNNRPRGSTRRSFIVALPHTLIANLF